MTPGLSGGVIAAAWGLYEPAVHAIVNAPKELRKSAVFLLPLAAGAGLGVVLFSGVMREVISFASYRVLYVFFGLVTGSLPFLAKEACAGGFRLKHLCAGLIAFGAVVAFDRIGGMSPERLPSGAFDVPNLLFYGAVLAVGTIVPGVSSSLILMYLGAYEGLLEAVTRVDLRILIPFGLGFVLAAAPLVKLVDVLFTRHRGPSYNAVIGFLLASMVIVFPGLRGGWDLAGDVFGFAAGAAASIGAVKLYGKKPA